VAVCPPTILFPDGLQLVIPLETVFVKASNSGVPSQPVPDGAAVVAAVVAAVEAAVAAVEAAVAAVEAAVAAVEAAVAAVEATVAAMVAAVVAATGAAVVSVEVPPVAVPPVLTGVDPSAQVTPVDVITVVLFGQ